MIDWIRAQLRRRHARRHLKRPAKTTPFGFEFFGPRTMQNGEFEPSETKLLRKLLLQADLFVNVGANFGYYVCMAKQMNVRSVAIEPVPINVETLERNLKINNWDADVVVHPVACGETAGTADMFGEGTGASFVSGWARNPNALKHTVPVERLDDLLVEEKVTAKSVFLVDVEGFELEVLRGAEKTLASPSRPVWMIESGLTDHRPGGEINVGFLEVLRVLFRNDYRVFSALETDFEVTLELVEKNIEQGVDELGTHNFLIVPSNFDFSLIDK